ncbi:hypothetical protein GE061_013671 [Apolygus lucorum]|uniref:Uncharacterized protein n=1 Tax=Apolygus lucorum TaxID=248454 RepID=A0A8S9XSI2_APOLU|nr:hypothetical protein GE061_013671 [Apolygus lucorum]
MSGRSRIHHSVLEEKRQYLIISTVLGFRGLHIFFNKMASSSKKCQVCGLLFSTMRECQSHELFCGLTGDEENTSSSSIIPPSPPHPLIYVRRDLFEETRDGGGEESEHPLDKTYDVWPSTSRSPLHLYCNLELMLYGQTSIPLR